MGLFAKHNADIEPDFRDQSSLASKTIKTRNLLSFQ